MTEDIGRPFVIEPRLIRRSRNLGWLAISPRGFGLRIGVVATSEDEARSRFCASYRRWLEILCGSAPKDIAQ